MIEFTEDEVRPERLEEGKKILRKLLGDKTSFVAKRQCMRANFGDYRTDMKSWRTLEHGRSKLGKINKALFGWNTRVLDSSVLGVGKVMGRVTSTLTRSSVQWTNVSSRSKIMSFFWAVAFLRYIYLAAS